MRVLLCLFLALPACASHAVRCDANLRPINAPAGSDASPVARRAAPDAIAQVTQ